MNFNKLSIVLAIVIVVGGIFVNKHLTSQKQKPERKAEKEDVRGVNTDKVVYSDIDSELKITGPLVSKNRMEIFAEVSGTLLSTPKRFKEGVFYQKGEPMILVQDDEFRMSLYGQRSAYKNLIAGMLPDLKIDYANNFESWKEYLTQVDEKNELQAPPATKSDKESFFVTAKNINSQYYNIKAQENRLKKYSLFAPFSGVVATSLIDPGTLVRQGQKLGELIGSYTYELEAGVFPSDLSNIRIGQAVELVSDDIKGSWKGRVVRIGKSLDRSTQMIKVFVEVNGKELREGMYLSALISLGKISKSLKVKRNVLIRDSEIFIIKDGILSKKAIELIRIEGQYAIIRGLEPGDEYLNESSTGKQNGMKISSNN